MASGVHSQHLKVRDAQIGLHNCNTFRNKTLTNSNKFIHIVTLRHNSTVVDGSLVWNQGMGLVD